MLFFERFETLLQRVEAGGHLIGELGELIELPIDTLLAVVRGFELAGELLYLQRRRGVRVPVRRYHEHPDQSADRKTEDQSESESGRET